MMDIAIIDLPEMQAVLADLRRRAPRMKKTTVAVEEW